MGRSLQHCPSCSLVHQALSKLVLAAAKARLNQLGVQQAHPLPYRSELYVIRCGELRFVILIGSTPTSQLNVAREGCLLRLPNRSALPAIGFSARDWDRQCRSILLHFRSVVSAQTSSFRGLGAQRCISRVEPAIARSLRRDESLSNQHDPEASSRRKNSKPRWLPASRTKPGKSVFAAIRTL